MTLSSQTWTVHSIDEFRAAIRPSHAKITPLASADFSAQVTRIDLHRLFMQSGRETAARIWHAEQISDRVAISFRAQPSSKASWNAATLRLDEVGVISPGRSYFDCTSGPTHWATMSLAQDDLREISIAIHGRDLTPRKETVSLLPEPARLAKLRRLHGAAIGLAVSAPEIIANADAARGLEHALVEAWFSCLDQDDGRRETGATSRQHCIVDRFLALLDEEGENALYVLDVCQRLRVPERTLRLCCHEWLGVGPKQYLLLRRMHYARDALRVGDANKTTVTEIATRFGFWELGRFSVAYRSLFGESPSAALSRAP